MRIEALSTFVAVVWLTALLCPWLAAAGNVTSSLSRRPREHPFRGHISHWTVPLEDTSNKRMTYREMQMVLRQEGGEDGAPVDCCPTIEEMVEPVGGRNRQDMYVELYRDGDNAQRFFEYSCRADVLEKPCRFVDRKLSNQSKCVQKFSYTYAIVKNPAWKAGIEGHGRHHHSEYHFPAFPGNGVGSSPWILDYVKVRSGCSCEVMPKPKKKKATATKSKKARSKLRQPRDHDSDLDI
ncbi:uncharacterized protein LOC107268265 [Cephus cinctus]|uniref:Uncharacterized protein LOC107268265 n=1 Tax=Cephus cinctus TaxID=211228 RepID=A0AAJ7FKK0_CEPCN|nr:uncharacterized protein LOC107268265 [Cephus cinctus]XP_015596361.1 uncharacterized protein LOC107268265 [Cephus cinctus]XP_015596364.1 uncharacterized protein LOC107268265 [Cephus cinctus]XP_015596366.1 uncharacterized protein LOC107268265 [Cephus cinctus]XP_024941324.1 uncharacterized protein LOC107268265 [Cephus cinctus]XP_024941325.1 uncharacterized protein LOC107268265 [Cephus cinctus]XP_024941326.1 uncharacterized protein LOC107268265 [Cephus cinctus]XP_024941327.1 uncharacterized p